MELWVLAFVVIVAGWRPIRAVVQHLAERLAEPPAAWLEAFRQANVEVVARRPRSLEGTRGPLRVSIERESAFEPTVVRISGGRVPLAATGITSLFPSVESFTYGKTGRFRVLTGDPELDRAVQLRGDERVIRALCDPATRQELRSMTDMGVRIEDSHVICAISDWDLQTRLAPLIDFIEGLVPPPDLGQRIADNTAREPVAAVRLGNVRVLAREFRDHPATRATLVAALNDAADEVCIEAAQALGDDGVRTLLKIALRSRSQDGHAAKAIAALPYHRFRPRHAGWLLRRASEARRVAVVNACLERLIINCDERSASALSAALWSEDDEVALAASRVLKDGGTARFEGTLIQALTHRLVDVQRDAVRALGRIGTVESVAPLADWAAHHAFDRFVRADAPRAIAAIQSRIPGASPGQVSLAGAEAGQVSLAGEYRRGEVSLGTAEEGSRNQSGAAERVWE